MKPIARRLARQYAVQALYQWQLTHASSGDIEADFLKKQINQRTDWDYFKELIYTIPATHTEIDAHLLPFLARPLAEVDPIELAILRLSIYELAKRLDIPYRVSINEALELTKKYGSIEGYKFVNGLLDQVARQLRALEMNSKK